MHHKGTKTIETERLILRAFVPEDADAAYRNWTSDGRVTEFLRWQTHASPAETEEVVRRWADKSSQPDFYQWAIVLRELGEPIGSISVVEKDERLGIVHVGYCIGSRWWHLGITSEAFSAIISFLFREVGANRIESQHDPDNPHSGDVMRKCGLRREGTLRQADHSNRGIVDACMHSLLRSEWEAGIDRHASAASCHEARAGKPDVDGLLQGPCQIIDVLPCRIPTDRASAYLAFERQMQTQPRRESLARRFAGVLARIACYHDLLVSQDHGDGWREASDPCEASALVRWVFEDEADKARTLLVTFGDGECALVIDGDCHYMTLFGGSDEMLGLVGDLARSEGLFMWDAQSGR